MGIEGGFRASSKRFGRLIHAGLGSNGSYSEAPSGAPFKLNSRSF